MTENKDVNNPQPEKRHKDKGVRMYIKIESEVYDDLMKISLMDRRLPADEVNYLIRSEVTRRKSLFVIAKYKEMLSTNKHPLLNEDDASSELQDSNSPLETPD